MGKCPTFGRCSTFIIVYCEKLLAYNTGLNYKKLSLSPSLANVYCGYLRSNSSLPELVNCSNLEFYLFI